MNKMLDQIGNADDRLLVREASNYSRHLLLKGKKSPTAGKPHSDEIRLLISQAGKGRKATAETKARMKAARALHPPAPRVQCVHCGKEATINNINRWHNDNCKLKPTTFTDLFG